MTLAPYLKNRRRWEMLIAVALIGTGAVANVIIELIDAGRSGASLRPAEPWILELTSNLALLMLFPAMLWFDGRNRVTLKTWRRTLPAHALFSVVFSLAHVTLMYFARVGLYRLAYSAHYHWDNWIGEFGYEYLKDFRSYLLILSAVYLYRFILLRLQGEAGYIDEEVEPSDTVASERFIVKKLGREFLVKATDIEWIESAGNYVNLHVNGKVYPLRDTMTHISEVLAPRGFMRVHRQAIVNVERISEIEVFDSGDGIVRLNTAARVPISRRYRQALRASVGAGK